MCEYIALINKSNKILDGKLNDIKTEFKENKFAVGLQCENSEGLYNEIKQKFSVEKSENYNDANLGITIKLPQNETSTNLIKFLNSKSQITHFTEIIPNANDIFLKAVANNE